MVAILTRMFVNEMREVLREIAHSAVTGAVTASVTRRRCGRLFPFLWSPKTRNTLATKSQVSVPTVRAKVFTDAGHRAWPLSTGIRLK